MTATPAPTDRGDRMSTPTPDRPQWSVTVTVPSDLPGAMRDSLFGRVANAAHLWEPSTRDGWDVDVSAGPAASAPQGDTTPEDVIEQARGVAYRALADAPRTRPDGKRFGSIEGDRVRADAVIDAFAAASLLAVSPPADAIERARHIIADHCFGPHATPAAEERALDIASACTDDMADQGLLAVAASPATPQAVDGSLRDDLAKMVRAARNEGWDDNRVSLAAHFFFTRVETESAPAPQAAEVARAFHEAYERLAPSFGYETRKASAKPWSDVPEPNRSLMIAVAGEVLASLSTPAPADDEAAIELDKLIEQLRGNAHAVRAFGFTEFAEGRANGIDVAIEALTKRAAALRQAAPRAADDEAAQVERMAAAIAKDDGFDWRSGEWNDVYLSRARAALAALKEGRKA